MANIKGTTGDDTLTGTDKNDTINGGLGADTMSGGLGSDIYYVDNAGDTIIEAHGEGTDTIYSRVSMVIPDNVENIHLQTSANLIVIGNDDDNAIYGNAGNNYIDGGGGADFMSGGGGSDTYVINIFADNGINNNSYTDHIVDSGGAADTVTTNAVNSTGTTLDLTYILQNGLENATFIMSDANFTLTGNNERNILITGDGDDIINGGRGADTMNGGDGANTFYVDNKNDVIIDTFHDFDMTTGKPDTTTADTTHVTASYVFGSTVEMEYIVLDGSRAINVTGSDTDNIITGNSARNVIHGGGGNDEIHTGGGRDVLYGDAGADTFYFDTDIALKAPVTIHDFSVAQGDKIDVADVLTGYADGDAVSNFVEIVDSGANSLVKVNAAGDGIASHFVTIATIYHVNGLTGEQHLLDTGNLIITHNS